MRTCWLPQLSSISDMRATRSPSPGQRVETSARKRALISKMMSSRRGSRRRNRLTGQRSSASGSKVWLV